MIPQPLGLLLTPDDLPGFFACPQLPFAESENGHQLRLDRYLWPRRQEIVAVTSRVLPLPDVRTARRALVNRAAPEGSPVALPRSYLGVRAWVRPLPGRELIEYLVVFRQGRMLAELITESRWLLAEGATPPGPEETLRLARLLAQKLSRAQGARSGRARFGRATASAHERLQASAFGGASQLAS